MKTLSHCLHKLKLKLFYLILSAFLAACACFAAALATTPLSSLWVACPRVWFSQLVTVFPFMEGPLGFGSGPPGPPGPPSKGLGPSGSGSSSSGSWAFDLSDLTDLSSDEKLNKKREIIIII